MIKMHKCIILPAILHEYEIWSVDYGKSKKLGCLRTGCQGEYFGLKGMK
jgi:hypothetical protein